MRNAGDAKPPQPPGTPLGGSPAAVGGQAARTCLRAGLAAVLVLLAAPLAAQQLPTPQREIPNIVIDVVVEGTTQIERGQILSGLRSLIGETLDPVKVTEDIKGIFELGYFQDVRAEAEPVQGKGYRLVIVVVERPRITSLDVVGSYLLEKSALRDLITVKNGSLYRASEVEKSLENVRDAYRQKGYLKIKASSQVKQHSEKEWGLTFIIEETPRIYITRISTKDTKVFSELEIKRMLRSAEVDCFDWVTDSGVFDETKINADLQGLSAAYLTQGYIRLFIDKPVVTLIHGREVSRIHVNLNIKEGEQYFTGKVDITGDILGEKDRLLDLLRLKTGDIFNPFKQNRDSFRLKEHYQEQGYAFVRVIPVQSINDSTRIVDITYQITRGDKAYIGRIDFHGNRETRDYVMRREIEVRENELYNGRKLRVSQENLRRLGYFKPEMSLTTEPAETDNILDVVAKVEESQTGTLQAQIGYSDVSGFTLAFSVSKGNLLGRGQTVRFSAQAAQRNVTRNFTFDFIEPHLLDTEISSDTSLSFRTADDFTELDRGQSQEVRGQQGFGYPILDRIRASISYEAVTRVFENEDTPAVLLRSFTPALSYNTVNHPVFPSAGSLVSLSASQVGGLVLGGTTEYRRYRLRMQRFLSLNESATVVLMGRLRLGWLESVGDNLIPPEERFRLGGITSLRGYRFFQVGGPYGSLEQELNLITVPALDSAGQPILDADGNALRKNVDARTLGLSEAEKENLAGGGITERLLNLEMIFPLAGDNVRGVIFYDAGEVNAEPEQYRLLGEREPEFLELRQSIGGGIRLISPLGVFRFEYGAKLNPEKGETPDRFDFTISTLF